MLSTSLEFQRQAEDDARWLVKAQLVLRDGTRVNLAGDDFAANSFSFDHSTSSQGSFDIGAAITGAFNCTLDNGDRRFDDYDFTGSRIIPQVGMALDSGGEEWLRKGTYWVEQPSSYGETIGLSCLDSMSKLDVDYAEVSTRYPATARTVALDIATKCGVTLANSNFANSSVVFKARPEGCSCRDVLSCLCQATGNYARMTAEDRLMIDWYDPSVWDDEDWLDGEEFDDGSPYQSGDTADGGSFDDYSSGATADGGTFDSLAVVSIYKVSSATIMTDDVRITGVRVTAQDEALPDGTKGRKGETVLAGAEGYVLDVRDNPLISYGEARATAQRLAARIVGLVFRPFDASCIGDPSWEPGDPAVLTDRLQNTYRAYLTRVCYKVGAYAAVACSAEAPLRRSAMAGGAVTRALQSLGDDLRAEQTARENAVRQLNDDLSNAPGVFITKKVEGGATTTYVHDKKNLKDSAFVWKMNAAGFGMSTDGGKSYAYGLDKWGNAILNTVYAIGLDASYINTGALRVRSGSKTIFCADVRLGQFWWDSTYSKLSSTGALTVTSGNIAGFSIMASGLYKGRSALYGTSDGVYVGTNGIAVGGNQKRYMAMTGGMLEGGYNNTRCGWLAFTRGGWGGSPGTGVTLNSAGALYLGCGSLYVCEPLSGNGGTLVTLGSGQNADIAVMVGADVRASYTEANWEWAWNASNGTTVWNNYKTCRMVHSVTLTRYFRTLKFRRGILVGYSGSAWTG